VGPKGVQLTAAWDAEREGGVQYCRHQLLLQRRVSRGCKGSKRGMGQQGIEDLCHMRQTLHWLLSGALILLKGNTAPEWQRQTD